MPLRVILYCPLHWDGNDCIAILTTFKEALSYIDEVIIGEKSWSEALSNPFQRLPYLLLRGRRALQQSANHVRNAWRTVRSGVTRWRGTRYLIIGTFCCFYPRKLLVFLSMTAGRDYMWKAGGNI